jgi:hypothetical protein
MNNTSLLHQIVGGLSRHVSQCPGASRGNYWDRGKNLSLARVLNPGLSHSNKRNNKRSVAFLTYEDKKESFSCTLQKTTIAVGWGADVPVGTPGTLPQNRTGTFEGCVARRKLIW